MNSIFNDRRMEAAAQKRGALIGPRCVPHGSQDDDGFFITYTGKVCGADGCGVQLTSRNRAGTRLMCSLHARELDRLRQRERRPSSAAKRARVTTAEHYRDPCPHRQAVHRALTGFLNHPTTESVYAHTLAVMRDYELRARLLQVIPRRGDDPVPVPPEIPVEEPTFDDPSHRTTHLEFLSDCNTYGA